MELVKFVLKSRLYSLSLEREDRFLYLSSFLILIMFRILYTITFLSGISGSADTLSEQISPHMIS